MKNSWTWWRILTVKGTGYKQLLRQELPKLFFFWDLGVCKMCLHLDWELDFVKVHLMLTDLGCTVLSESRTICSVTVCFVCTVCSQWLCQHRFSSFQAPVHIEGLLVECLTPVSEDSEYWWNKSTLLHVKPMCLTSFDTNTVLNVIFTPVSTSHYLFALELLLNLVL